MTTSNNDFSHFERIEAYLFDTMPSNEKAVFESELVTDKALAEQVKTHRLEHLAMRELRAQALRQEVNSWATPETRIIGLPRRQFFQWAAAAAVLAVVGIIGLRLSMNPSSSELSNRLFVETLPPIVESTKSAPTEGAAWAGVIAALSGIKPNYNQALTELDKLPSEVQTNLPDRIALLRGRCQYGLKAYNEAAHIFEQLMVNGVSSDARQEAEWARVLCLLAINDKSADYQQALKNLSAKPTKFKQQAESLLKEQKSN